MLHFDLPARGLSVHFSSALDTEITAIRTAVCHLIGGLKVQRFVSRCALPATGLICVILNGWKG